MCSVNNGGCPSDAICKVLHSLTFIYLLTMSLALLVPALHPEGGTDTRRRTISLCCNVVSEVVHVNVLFEGLHIPVRQ